MYVETVVLVRRFLILSYSTTLATMTPACFGSKILHVSVPLPDDTHPRVSFSSSHRLKRLIVRAETQQVEPHHIPQNHDPKSRDDSSAASTKFSFRSGRKKDAGFRRVVTHFDGDDFSALSADLSLETCNAILKKLESGEDPGKALGFFEWMRGNGKLDSNAVAYNLVLRVLSRRRDWVQAENLIKEMWSSGFELDHQPYNTLIYAASKKGLVDMGARLFRMMLNDGVSPNVATFGMLMTLYQKYWKVEEAEFSFCEMRKLQVRCQSAYSAMITIYTRLRLFGKAEQVIGLLTEDGILFNLENWLVSLNAYCQQGKMGEAQRLLSLMTDAGIPPNIVAYNTLITGYGKISDMEGAQRMFGEMNDVGLVPDETTYRTMIEGWGRAGKYTQALRFYNELKRLGFTPNSSNLYTLLNLFAKNDDEKGVARILQDMTSMGCQCASMLATLLQAYELAARIHKIPLIIRGLFYQHVLINQTSCSSVVMAYVKHGLVDEAIQILKEKRWKDTGFEDNLHHLLICSCKESGNSPNAIKIYSQLAKSDSRPNLHILCTMMDIYTMMGSFGEAEEAFLTLKRSKISLDIVAYTIAVRMFVKAGSLESACSVLEMMNQQKDITPDIYMFRDMLRIYQRCGMTDKLIDLYHKILKSGIPWDQEMYNCVINCCSQALPVDDLSRLFDEMLDSGFTPNTITYSVMINVYGKSGLFKKARRAFWLAQKQGLVDIITYNTMIGAYGKNKQLNRIRSTIRKMQFHGFTVSLEAYNCMLDAYGKKGQIENFRTVLKHMKDANCASDHYTYNIMINIYGEQGWIEEVAGVLTELKESGLKPDLYSYNTLIKAYGIAGMVEDAVALLKEMRENGIQPDRITFSNLIAALRRNDKFLEAVKWSLWMKQLGLS
uniref:Pentatricopeptide repeat-containing protein n=1 Tax=Kalanchoe fedtschenkoi TaxID=63787 RepID=A0A7N0T5N1_KALFE